MGEDNRDGLRLLLERGRAASDDLKLDVAIDAYRQAVALDERSLAARLGLARILMKMRRQDETRQQLDVALELAPDNPETLTVMGSLHFLMDENAQAIETLGRAIALNEADAEPRVILAQALADQKEFERADQELEAAQALIEPMADDPERQRWLAMVWHARTYAQLAAGKNADAMASAQEVIALKEFNAYAACLAYSNMGILQMRQRKYDLAIEYLEEAFALNPFFYRAGHALGRLLVVRKRYSRAVEVMTQVIEHLPDPPAGERYTYATALAKDGQRQEALQQHKLALAAGLSGLNGLAARWQLVWLSEWGRYAIIGLGMAAILAWIVMGKPSTQSLTFLGLLALLLILQRTFGQRRR
jgi:tetratricopeptide (TPR) repeat protein